MTETPGGGPRGVRGWRPPGPAAVLRAVTGRELAGLWVSPAPWVVAALAQAVLGILFVDALRARQQAVVQPLFPLAGFLLLVVVPVLTMRTVADEHRAGTWEVLVANGVPPGPFVVAKWLASWLSAMAVLAPAAVHPVLLAWWGEPDTGPLLTGTLGLALLAAALCGLGVMVSAATSSLPVAAFGTFAPAAVAWFLQPSAASGPLRRWVAHLSLSERLRTFAGGGIDTSDVTFLIVVTVGSLVVAATVLDLRRLR